MAYYLPSNSNADSQSGDSPRVESAATGEMGDLKIFWGPEICRLEYLIHLLDTGRIIDERAIRTA